MEGWRDGGTVLSKIEYCINRTPTPLLATRRTSSNQNRLHHNDVFSPDLIADFPRHSTPMKSGLTPAKRMCGGACRNPSLSPHQIRQLPRGIRPAWRPFTTTHSPRVGQSYLRKMDEAEEQWAEQAVEIRAGKKKSMLVFLEERELVHSTAGNRDELEELMTSKRIGAYCGVDPTAPSLHIGHLLPLMVIFWLYLHGFQSLTVLGAATARIGDPTGRKTARDDDEPRLDRNVNILKMHYQIKKLWQNVEVFAGSKYGYKWEWAWRRAALNNIDWQKNVNFIQMLVIMGRGLKVSTLLAKDSMKERIKTGQKMGDKAGLSFAELSYPILQAWDFWHLYKQRDIQLQVGGCDQYGNITTGIDAVKFASTHFSDPDVRVDKDDPSMVPYGLTTPLLTRGGGPNGEKMGKSTGNAVWLSPEMTSSFELYQFFMLLSDTEVERYWKMFTFKPLPDIAEIMKTHNEAPHKRQAHHQLAREFLTLHHGGDAAKSASAQHAALFASKATVQNLDISSMTTAPPSSPPVSHSPANAEIPMSTQPILRPASAISPPSKPARPILEHTQVSPSTSQLHHILYPASLAFNQPITKILCDLSLCASKTEAHKMLTKQHGIYFGLSFLPLREPEMQFRPRSQDRKGFRDWNAQQSPSSTLEDVPANGGGQEVERMAKKDDGMKARGPHMDRLSAELEPGNLLVLRRGKWNVRIAQVVPDREYDQAGKGRWSEAWRAYRATTLKLKEDEILGDREKELKI